MSLHGRNALVTGGAGGIGLAIARRFAAAGARVALADIRHDAADAAANGLRALGHEAFGLECDVSKPSDAESVVEQAVSAFGSLDILINNAGYMGRVAPLCEQSLDDWNRVLAVDLTSVFLLSRAALPHMRAQKRGCIVNMASIAGKEGTPNLVPYSVAKAGIIAFTKALGKEVVGDGIRVNCVAPGVVETPLLDQLTDESKRLMLSKVPMQRFGTADEVAAIVQFLVSDDASYITAQCLDASGGRATY